MTSLRMDEWVHQNRPGLIEDFGLTLYPKVINNPVIGEKLINLNWMVCDLASANYELLLADNRKRLMNVF